MDNFSFKKTHPDYLSYQDNQYHYTTVPSALTDQLTGIFIRLAAEKGVGLKAVCNQVTNYIPTAPTQNWGYDYIKSDFVSYMQDLAKKLPNFMDCMAAFIDNDSDLKAPIEEAFEECKFGYFLDPDIFPIKMIWLLKEDTSASNAPLQDAIAQTKDVCQATHERLELTLKKLAEVKTALGRKDAMREAMHALEGFMKKITATNDIQDADKALRADPDKWGSDKRIIGDGMSIWDRFHQKHPDLRHGNPETTDISKEDVIYWIMRISIFISYLNQRERVSRI